MRLALLTPTYWPLIGGMERFADDLASWLAAHGNDVAVYTPVPALPGSDDRRPYPVVRRPFGPWLVPALRRVEAVHANGLSIRAVTVARAAGRRPVVTHAHHQAICPAEVAWSPWGRCTADGGHLGPCAVCYRQGLDARRTLWSQRLGTHLAGMNVCISEYLARRVAVPRSTVIYNPVGPEAFATGAANGRSGGLVAYAGRIANEKGVDLLVHALARVPGARLEVAGDGPKRPEVEALTDELGLRPRVRFLGPVGRTQLLDLYDRAAVACVPSVCEEPFGYAAAEAMARGTPVVATPTGAMPELLADGRGFLSATTTTHDLARALTEALEDDGARVERARLSLAFARANFHVDVIGPRYVSCYERVASQRS